MPFIQTRPCDQQCCKDGPRFPTPDKTDCEYRGVDECLLMAGFVERDGVTFPSVNRQACPKGDCPALPGMKSYAAVVWSCAEWPHNMPGWQTGNCCWEWTE